MSNIKNGYFCHFKDVAKTSVIHFVIRNFVKFDLRLIIALIPPSPLISCVSVDKCCLGAEITPNMYTPMEM